MGEKRTTKTQKVLEHLEEKGCITSFEAIELYGATRLAAIIFELKKHGHNIVSEDVKFVDRFGTKTHYSNYILKK